MREPPAQRSRWEAIGRKLFDEERLTADMRNGALSGRSVNILAGLIAVADGRGRARL
jgi:hypothetical protein